MAPTRGAGSRKRGRPRKAAAQPFTKPRSRESKHAVTTQRTGRQRTSQAQDNHASLQPAVSRTEPARGRRPKAREAAEDGPDEIAAETKTTRKYVRLAPKTKRIHQALIDKWPPISVPVLEQIGLVLRRAKDGVVLSERPNKREQAVDVLNPVVREFQRHFSSTKMPSQAKAVHFDLDRLAGRNENIYRELTTARHRKQLLEEQVEHAAVQLNAEEELTDKLKENAQQWRRRWKSQGKSQLHPLLQQVEDVTMTDDKPEDVGLRKSGSIDTSLLDTPDSELAPLLEQLRRNLETMQGNHAQVEGIDEAVKDAEVALDELLFKHAGAVRYDAP